MICPKCKSDDTDIVNEGKIYCYKCHKFSLICRIRFENNIHPKWLKEFEELNIYCPFCKERTKKFIMYLLSKTQEDIIKEIGIFRYEKCDEFSTSVINKLLDFLKEERKNEK